MKTQKLITPGLYRHNKKNNLYWVSGVILDATNGNEGDVGVLYYEQNCDRGFFRHYDEFMEPGRFTLVAPCKPPPFNGSPLKETISILPRITSLLIEIHHAKEQGITRVDLKISNTTDEVEHILGYALMVSLNHDPVEAVGCNIIPHEGSL